MRIEAVELVRLELDLVHSLATSTMRHAHRPVVLVRLALDGSPGVGECVALAEPTYTEEWADGAELVLAEQLLPRLVGERRDVTGIEDALAPIAPVRGNAMAKAAVEMALLDALLRLEGRSLSSYLGASATSIDAGANVSIGDPESVCRDVEQAVSLGYRRVKVKIAPGRDVRPLAAVREAFPDTALSADANGAYDLANDEHVASLLALDELGLTYLEQPTEPGDHRSSARCCAMLETPVILDESVASLNDLEQAIALSALDGCSIKPGRIGGLLPARRAHDRLASLGMSCAIGGMLESGIARAASIALGALSGFDLPGDLGASDRYFVPDLGGPHRLLDGRLAVPDGPGLGVAIDEDAIAASSVRSRRIA